VRKDSKERKRCIKDSPKRNKEIKERKICREKDKIHEEKWTNERTC
jgi:hypothetical protein